MLQSKGYLQHTLHVQSRTYMFSGIQFATWWRVRVRVPVRVRVRVRARVRVCACALRG